ncbi:MAG: 3-phosphoserine/phosphohydroxythreonine transaminase [Verrucomicrobia bacterium]|nr:3-phosphoserine/phosphohydroxythreonine transaminase [Verrucomicrobiota bacterium]MCH8513895.1 3-phosphoserine/phosphohydroxythreonine transaminase [Kiritimatiellia bacterium]
MKRIYNFSAGPATLPLETLQEAQEGLLDYQGSGMSIMEMSHRGKHYDAVHQEALSNFRELLSVPDTHEIIFMQGGATSQFSFVPMNLLGQGETADYINSGAWAKKAIEEAKFFGKVNVAANFGKEIPTRQAYADELQLTPGAAYLHCTSNETISGAQIKAFPESDAPLVSDMSSDILSRALDVSKFGLIYAGAQKNLGPSGVTLVILRKDLAEKVADTVPMMFRYQTHIENQSLYNTPPTFGIYILCLVTRWLKKQGGVAAMEALNNRKSAKLYAAIDESEFYRGTALPEFRSTMNVTWRLPSEELEAQFIKEAKALEMDGLKGHRSVGGIRASIYNAFPEAGVDALIAFMKDFEAKNG